MIWAGTLHLMAGWVTMVACEEIQRGEALVDHRVLACIMMLKYMLPCTMVAMICNAWSTCGRPKLCEAMGCNTAWIIGLILQTLAT